MSGESIETPLQYVRRLFEEQIPFNRLLGVSVSSVDYDRTEIRFEMREELVGNFVHGSLHGGVISAILDLTGGLVAFAGQFEGVDPEASAAVSAEKLARTGTIDLRVDYLRPGKGRWFRSTGFVLRRGARVVVIRMELHNDNDELIAVGTGAYNIG